MRVEERSFPDPLLNLTYDDEALRRAEKSEGGEVLRLWESSRYFVVLGRTSKEEEDVDLEACRKDGIPVLRRSSGGGTVLQGPGCLNFSLVLSRKKRSQLSAITGSYRFILECIVKGLKAYGVDSEFRPVCDLVLTANEKKFSGNAQRRGRDFILHHGTILYGFDLALISRYLKMPKKMPDYRAGRSHADFVANLDVSRDAIRDALRSCFLKDY